MLGAVFEVDKEQYGKSRCFSFSMFFSCQISYDKDMYDIRETQSIREASVPNIFCNDGRYLCSTICKVSYFNTN